MLKRYNPNLAESIVEKLVKIKFILKEYKPEELFSIQNEITSTLNGILTETNTFNKINNFLQIQDFKFLTINDLQFNTLRELHSKSYNTSTKEFYYSDRVSNFKFISDKIENSNLLIEFLNKFPFKDDNVFDINRHPEKDVLRITTKNYDIIELNSLAGGYQYLFGLYSSINSLVHYSSETKIILLEEPEIGLHPKLQKEIPKILEAFTQNGVQFLISTHSPFIISAAAKEENQKVYLIEKGKTKDADTEELNTLSSQNGYSGYEAKVAANKMLGAGLDDLMDEVIFCEGSQTSNKNPEFDAKIYNTIFFNKGYNFVSAGGGNLLLNTQTTINITKKYFNLEEARIVKDSDILDETVKDSFIQEYKEKGYSLTYLKKQCIEAYLYHNDIVIRFFAKLDIQAGDDFNSEWSKLSLETKRNTQHEISDKMIKLICNEIHSKSGKSLDKNHINLQLAEIIREMGKEEKEETNPNIYWQLYTYIFGEK